MYGFMLTAIGAFIFVPAALSRQFEVFLLGLFSIGTGLAILQTAANPYVTIIGPIDSAAQRMSIMGVCNKTAGIIAPLILAALILKPGDSELFAQIESGALDAATQSTVLDSLIRRVIVPYSVLGVLLLLVGIGIRYSVLPEINTDEQNAAPAAEATERRACSTIPTCGSAPWRSSARSARRSWPSTRSSITPARWASASSRRRSSLRSR